jgi:cell division protein FtsB
MVNGWLSNPRYCCEKVMRFKAFSGMWTRHHKKRKFGRFVVPAITVAFLSYFGYHCIHGEYGLIATERFERQRLARSGELSRLTETRVALERQVEALSDGSLERDMIDEIARYQLNVSRTDEIVILNGYF